MTDATLGSRQPRIQGPRATEAYRRARQLLIDGEIKPGDTLSEAKLVRITGVSRTPVREALQRLEAEGYVALIPARGYVVVELSDEDVVNIYEVRAVLEGLAAASAATSVTRATLGRFEDLFEAMENARGRGDDQTLAALNSEFHRTIAEASGNNYLLSMLDGIYDVFERFRIRALQQPGRRDSAAGEHRELVDALRDKDAARARSIAERHVQYALRTRQDALGSVSK